MLPFQKVELLSIKLSYSEEKAVQKKRIQGDEFPAASCGELDPIWTKTEK